MRKLFDWLLVVMSSCNVLCGTDYLSLGVSDREFIINEVSSCLVDSDVAVLYSKYDEKHCSDELIPGHFVGLFNLGHYRKIAFLKGRDRLELFSDFYTYKPEALGEPKWLDVYDNFDLRLGGLFLGDNQLRVMFVRKSRGINRAEADRGGFAKMFTESMLKSDPDYRPKEYLSDFDKLDSAAYLEKYGLSKAFDIAVYDITCIVSFGFSDNVDMFLPESLPGAKSDERSQPNPEWVQRQKEFLVQVSKRELSELVYIAYVCDDDSGGIEAYNESRRKNPQFLVPLSEPVEFKTELGRKIHQKITTGHVDEDAEFDRLDW